MEKLRQIGNGRIRDSKGYLVVAHHAPLGVEAIIPACDTRVFVRNPEGYLTGAEPLATKDMLQQGVQLRERIRLAQQISQEPVTVVDLPPSPSNPHE